MHNLFQKGFSPLHRRRTLLFAAVALFTMLCLWRSSSMTVRENILDMLPAKEKSVDDFTTIVSRFGYQNRLFFDISAGDNKENASSAADALYEELQKTGWIKRFVYRVNEEEGLAALDLIDAHLPALFGPEEQDYLAASLPEKKVRERLAKARATLYEMPVSGPFAQSLREDPLSVKGIFLTKLAGFQYGNRIEKGRIWSADGKHIMLVAIPKDAYSEGDPGRELVAWVEKTRKDLAEAYPNVTIRYIGALRIAGDNREMMMRDIALSTTLSTLFVLLLSFAVYRRAILVLLSMIPVVFGGVLATACFALFSNTLSAIVASFGGVLIGIAVDYVVYVIFRYDHYAGRPEDAEGLSRHLSVIVAPIVMGATTTVAAFLCLLLSSLPGHRQLGVFAAIGISGAALFSLVVLPHMLPLHPPKRKKPFIPLADLWGWFFEWHSRHTGLCLGVLGAVVVLAFFGVSKVVFDGDLKKMSGMHPETHLDETAISEQWGGPLLRKTLVAVRGATIEEAQQKNDRLYATLRQLKNDGKIENFDSISPFAPSLKTQQENIERWGAFWGSGQATRVKRRLNAVGRENGFSSDAFAPFYEKLSPQGDVIPITKLQEGALGELMGGFVSEQKGDVLILSEVQAGSGYDALSGIVLGQMPDALVYNGDAFARRISKLVVKVSWWFTWVSLACSFAILLLGYRRTEILLIILAALGLDVFLSLGVLGWLGIPVNLMNNIFLLFIFGMCIDYAIYVTSAYLSVYANPTEDIGVAGGAVALSALTTIGAFGTLVVARHPALRSIGLTASIVMIIGLLVAAGVVPLAMRFLLQKKGRHGAPPTLRTMVCGLSYFSFFGLTLLLCRFLYIPWIRLRYPNQPVVRRKKLQGYLRASARLGLRTMPLGKRIFLIPEPEVFSKPAVIVCNHQSVIDIISALCLPANFRMVVKPWVWNSFFMGPVIREAGYLLVDGTNTDEVLSKVKLCLQEGDSVLLFPEGKRSETGRIARFKRGAFEAAVLAQVDILPVVMCETRSCVPKGGFWIGDHRVIVRVMSRISTEGKESLDLARQTRVGMAAEYENALSVACDGPEFLKRIRGYYNYLGQDVESFVARRLRHETLYREISNVIPREAVVLDLGKDFGLMANILAAKSSRISVMGFNCDPTTVAVTRQALKAPERMTYSVREKREQTPFPRADAVLASLDASLSLDEMETVLTQSNQSLRQGGRLVLEEALSTGGVDYSRLLQKAGFTELKRIGEAILCEKTGEL
jgi:1-acyl-sn-glycerol-3-phosphate acyltransferase